jgi:predicted RNase H-like HicB family nuclease
MVALMKKVKLHIELTKAEEGGYVVYCPELDITTEGETVDEAMAMIKDAAAGYIDVVGFENIPAFSGKILKEELEMVVNG